ncbi:MAG: antitoxin family protein [Thermoanaerobaculia bacterium]
MTRILEAVYEDGVLRPLEDPGLAEHQLVLLEIQTERRGSGRRSRLVLRAQPGGPEGAVEISEDIDGLYVQIRELVARSAAEPDLRQEIDLLVQRLRALQQREAVDLERLLKPRRRLEAGAGWDALARVDRLLGE